MNEVLTGDVLAAFVCAVVLFCLGVYCLLTMRNLIRLLIGVEVMTKGVTLAFIASGFAGGNIFLAQCFVITIIVVEVSVIAVALALIVNAYRHTGSLDIRELTKLKG
jgi:NADH:ubiquinone oxidoreductase subunit K